MTGFVKAGPSGAIFCWVGRSQGLHPELPTTTPPE